MELYYKLRNGKWVYELAIETAFLVTTGKERHAHRDEYLDWLESYLNNTILEVKSSTDPELFNELLTRETKIMAMQVYRNKHNCTLAEARDVVEWLLGKEDDNGKA